MPHTTSASISIHRPVTNSLRNTRGPLPPETSGVDAEIGIGDDVMPANNAVLDALGSWSLATSDAGDPVRVRRAKQRDVAACAAAQRRLSCLQRCATTKAAHLVEFGASGLELFAVYEAIEFGDDLASMMASSDTLDIATFTPLASQILAAIEPMHAMETTIGMVRPVDVRIGTRDGRALHVIVQDLAWISPGIDGPALPDPTLGALVPPEGIHDSLASDVYALGALFGRMLSGRWPSASQVRWPTDAPTPAPLRALVEQMLNPDPLRRPDNASAVIERLVVAVPARLFALPRTSPSGMAKTSLSRGVIPPARRPESRGDTQPTAAPARQLTSTTSAPGESNADLLPSPVPQIDSRPLVAESPGPTHSPTQRGGGDRRRSVWIAAIVATLACAGVVATCQASPDAAASVAGDRPVTVQSGTIDVAAPADDARRVVAPAALAEPTETETETDNRPNTARPTPVTTPNLDAGPDPHAVVAPPIPSSHEPPKARPQRSARKARDRRPTPANPKAVAPTPTDAPRPSAQPAPEPADAAQVSAPVPTADRQPSRATATAPDSSLFNPHARAKAELKPDSPFLPPSR